MTYISFCSGIEAATVAWEPLGWKPLAFSEIASFPSRVLFHHYPGVPNLGDFTAVDWSKWQADICVGGTPCQAFSVAGARKSLADDRGNLTLEFIRAVNTIRPRFVVWENVPGVLSTRDNAFGCFLAGLVGCDEAVVPELYSAKSKYWRTIKRWAHRRKIDGEWQILKWWPERRICRWPNAGVVDGPSRRIAWRILDAQYFRLAQRRKRVFVVASAGDGPHPAEILFEWESLRRDSPPRRKAGEGATRGIEIGPRGGRFTDVNPTLDARCKDGPIRNQLAGAIAMCLNAKGGVGPADAESETFIPTYGIDEEQNAAEELMGTLKARQEGGGQQAFGAEGMGDEGFDASEDGTGRGTPLVPIAFDCKASGQNGFGVGEVASTMRSMGHTDSHQNGGGHLAVAVNLRGREGGAMPELSDVASIRAASGGSSRSYVAQNTYSSQTDYDWFQGIINYADAIETDASSLLRRVREEVGAEALAEWGLGVFDSLQSTEILRSKVHGGELRLPAIEIKGLVHKPLPRTEDMPHWSVREMWIAGRHGRTPQRWKLSQQLSRQLRAHLSQLSQQGASAEGFLYDLREACKGVRVLRYALPEVQAVGRSTSSERQPVCSSQERNGIESHQGMQSDWLRKKLSRARLLRNARTAVQEGQIAPVEGGQGLVMAVRRLTPL